MIRILDEEKEFYAQINEQLEKVQKNGKIFLTKFLSLREQQIVKELVKQDNIKISFYGGYPNAERQRCLIYHEDCNINAQYHILCFKILFNRKYLTLTHQNVLGTLMSLKLDRTLFGDIIFIDDDCFFFAVRDIELILYQEFNKINNVPINIELYDKPITYEPQYRSIEVIVSSLRIDNIISHVYNLSREKAKALFLENAVYLNFKLITNASTKCQEKDVISVRKKGRFIVSEVLRKTKSNKTVLKINIPTS